MKIERLLAIVLILLNRRKATAAELSERFGVSIRTIYRDLETIDAAGIPIVSHQGTGGGFSVVDTYRLEKQLLSPDEILSMVTVLKGVGAALGDPKVLRSGKKIESLVPNERATKLRDEVRIVLSPWGYRGGLDALLETLRKATSSERKIRFSYLNSEGETIERTAEPMTLVYKGSAWYLFAYCLLREDYRMFRLSRMRDMTVIAESFERRPYNYDTYARRFESAETLPSLHFKLRFSPKVRFLVEDGFARGQIANEPDGSMIVSAKIPTGDWLLGWFLSFGEHLEILEPQSYREMMAATLRSLLDRYRATCPEPPAGLCGR